MKFEYIRLGKYIKRSTINNKDEKYGTELIVGVNNEGIFTSPKGDPKGVNLKPYKIVNNGAFVYNPSRLDLGSIAYRTEGLCIVSHLYIVFYLNEAGIKRIDPMFLYMYFRRNEFYREVRFRNFGSQRPEFNFNDMSEIIIPLPPLSVQQKYVDIYNSMLANQRCYERGLEDLKLSFDALLDKFKHSSPKRSVGELLEEVDVRNSDNTFTEVSGVNITKQFMPSVASSSDLHNYKIVSKNQFVYSGMQTGRDECIRIALLDKDEPVIVSPAYSVLKVRSNDIVPEFVQMWFSRSEMDRLGWFMSDSSIRSNLDLPRFYEIKIPVPTKEGQESIVNIYSAYTIRRSINERLKAQIKDLCPILVKGAVEEGERE